MQRLFVGELGNDQGRIEDSVQNDLKFVREIQGLDSSGNQRFGEPILVRSSVMGAHLVGYGTRVAVGYDFDGELAILGADYKSMIQSGVNPAVLNYADPRTKTVSTNAIPQLLSFAVADVNTASLKVAVNPFVYRDFLGELRVFNGEQTDLTSFVPSTTGNHALVVLFLDMRDNTIVVHSSTEKAGTIKLSYGIDLAEVYDAASIYAIPIKGWKLEQGQTTITQSSQFDDLRPFVNTAQSPGFPSPITRETVVPVGVAETFHGTLTVTGTLTVEGTLTIIDDDEPVINKTEITADVVTVTSTLRTDGARFVSNETSTTTATMTTTNSLVPQDNGSDS
ncbi:hypothetical protein LCGC14_1927800 [marine sediment metagenome]|uniref:Uncharacterized protein n=1 Tax=marine sediment metagenome TaxID=412755 RepID=A0A0F9FNV9_9ZZZZ